MSASGFTIAEYPQSIRWKEQEQFVSGHRAPRTIAVNVGFWLDNPDIYATTRMEREPVVRGFEPSWPDNFMLRPGTWSPFNSQNTAMMRDVVPSYLLSPYIGQYDDIWASYVINRISEHFRPRYCVLRAVG